MRETVVSSHLRLAEETTLLKPSRVSENFQTCIFFIFCQLFKKIMNVAYKEPEHHYR